MDKVMNLLRLESGTNGTWCKILDVKKVDNIKIYPSIKNGKVMSALDVDFWDDFYKHKVEVVFPGYALLVQGNGVCAAEDIKDKLGNDYKAISVSPECVEVYKKSDYESAINNIIKGGAVNV